MSGRRTTLTALSALAATTVFTVPAGATVFEQAVFVHQDAHIDQDGAITLSGSYYCEQASPMGAMQIKATVIQEGAGRLTVGTGDLLCDGAEHIWKVHTPQFGAGVHRGHATATADLQEIRLQGLMPKSVDTVAQDTQKIVIR
ncbi:DUF6299 family protein [Streptomyces sp. NPDC006430]|uniref:DUF6299 family protein n=1 Tax=Streptomyces sp. NPDC006430 TaxID=3154299 RepID=UPI0033B92C7A